MADTGQFLYRYANVHTMAYMQAKLEAVHKGGGRDLAESGLPGKPDPAMMLREAEMLGVAPDNLPPQGRITLDEDALGEYAGRYTPNRRTFEGFETLFTGLNLMSVAVAEDGIVVSGGGASERYWPMGEDVFENRLGARILFQRGADGEIIRIPMPPLTEERRKEMVKVAHKYAEEARVAIRHVRRDGLDTLKKLEKEGLLSQDDEKRQAGDVQKATDEHVAEVDGVVAAKEKEIMQV